MTTSYIGSAGEADAPRGFRPLMERALLRTREVLKEVSRLLDNNPIFLKGKGSGRLRPKRLSPTASPVPS